MDIALLPILALPLVILKFDDTWLFAYSAGKEGFIDTWVYFGYFLDFFQHLHTFRSGYFGGRLPWVLPGAAAYHLFRPITAAYVLHLAFCWLALVSLYLTLKITVGRRAAFVSALLMGCYCYFLWAIGWDYVDGAAITYFLLTLWLLTRAARAQRPRAWLIASGVAAALALYSHLFLITFAPLVVLYYRFAAREYGSKLLASPARVLLRGFLAVTALFAVLNVVWKAAPLFFIVPAASRAFTFVGRNRWFDRSYSWLSSATWLLLPGLAVLGAVLLMNARRSRSHAPAAFGAFWQLYLVLSVLIMVLWQAIGQPVLQFPFVYTSLLIPAVFLALGGQLAAVLEPFKRWEFVALGSAAAGILLLSFVLPLHSAPMLVLRQHPSAWPLGLGAPAVALLAFQPRYTRALAVLLLCAACGALTAGTGTRTWGHAGQPDDPALGKQAFLTVVDSVRAVREIDPTDHLYFWYDLRAPLGPLHRSVASTFMWTHRLVSERFPLLGTDAPPPLPLPKPSQRIAILTVDDDALAKAQRSLSEIGLRARFLGEKHIQEGPIGWKMILIETESTD